MNKPLAIGLGVLACGVLAYVGATAWAGHTIQSAYEAQLDKLGTERPFVKVTDLHYDKGLWSATSTVTLQIECARPAVAEGEGDTAAEGNDGAAAHEPKSFTLRHAIQHGPLVGGKVLGAAVIDTEFVLSEQEQQEVAKLIGEAKPMTVRSVVGFDGGYTSTLHSAAVRFSAAKGHNVVWQGLTATVRGDRAGTHADYEVHLPGFDVVDENAGVEMTFGRMTLKGHAMPLNGSWLVMSGKGEGEIERFDVGVTLHGQPDETIRMSGSSIKFATDTSADGELLNSVTSMSGSLVVDGFKLDRFESQTSLKRLHGPTYQRIVSAVVDSVFGCDPSVPALDSPDMAELLRAEVDQLLLKDPVYSLDRLVVEIDGHRGELSASIGVKDMTLDALALEPQGIMLTKGVVQADMKLPVAWIERLFAPTLATRATADMPPAAVVNLMLDAAADQGFVVRDGDNVSSSLRYGGRSGLQVNGKPLPFGRLAGK